MTGAERPAHRLLLNSAHPGFNVQPPMPPKATPSKKLSAPQDAALGWLVRLQSGRLDPTDTKAFQSWLEEDPAHAEAYARASQLWNSPLFETALNQYAGEALSGAACSKPWRWAAAASLLLALGWGLTAFGWLDRWRADFATATGEQQRIELADGSSVLLNTDSALSLDFGPDHRGVTLLSGEAFFEVAHDSFRPFVVHSGPADVHVVGTRFAVRAGAQTQVDVESGIVQCANQAGDSVQLTRGQGTAVSASRVAHALPIDPVQAFAWTKRRIAFRDRPLKEILAQLDRYHPGAIVVLDTQLGDRRVTGNYKLQDTSAIIRSLANVTGGRVTEVHGLITALR